MTTASIRLLELVLALNFAALLTTRALVSSKSGAKLALLLLEEKRSCPVVVPSVVRGDIEKKATGANR